MEKFEYIKWYWKYQDKETPVVLFYEVDLENERYATRMMEVFIDRHANTVMDEGFDYITEAPVPTLAEINNDDEFFAEIISRDEFERIYALREYDGVIEFPIK